MSSFCGWPVTHSDIGECQFFYLWFHPCYWKSAQKKEPLLFPLYVYIWNVKIVLYIIHKKSTKQICSQINLHKNVPEKSEFKLEIFYSMETTQSKQSPILSWMQWNFPLASGLDRLFMCFFALFPELLTNIQSIWCMSTSGLLCLNILSQWFPNQWHWHGFNAKRTRNRTGYIISST